MRTETIWKGTQASGKCDLILSRNSFFVAYTETTKIHQDLNSVDTSLRKASDDVKRVRETEILQTMYNNEYYWNFACIASKLIIQFSYFMTILRTGSFIIW